LNFKSNKKNIFKPTLIKKKPTSRLVLIKKKKNYNNQIKLKFEFDNSKFGSFIPEFKDSISESGASISKPKVSIDTLKFGNSIGISELEVPEPEFPKSEILKSEFEFPESEPEFSKSEFPDPEIVGIPEFEVPESEVVDISELELPEFEIPESEIPEFKIPKSEVVDILKSEIPIVFLNDDVPNPFLIIVQELVADFR